MADQSSIEWTDSTWNPVLGCSKVSEGCRGCYAIGQAHIRKSNPNPKVAEAFAGLTHLVNGKPEWTNRINLLPERLEQPLHWRKGRRIFVNSLSDLFHQDVPEEFVDRVFAVMALTPQHTYQVLTKRPDRMAEYCSDPWRFWRCVHEHFIGPTLSSHDDVEEWCQRKGVSRSERDRRKNLLYYDTQGNLDRTCLPLPNVWLGTSVEDQPSADARIPHLLRCPARVRFLSCEPLLGPVDLERWLDPVGVDCPDVCPERRYVKRSEIETACRGDECYPLCPDCGAAAQWTGYDEGLDWVIVGGESGAKARRSHIQWYRDLRDQCVRAGVPFFFKQWGEWTVDSEDLETTFPGHDNALVPLDPTPRRKGQHLTPAELETAVHMRRVGKKAAGRVLDGRTWDELPEVA